MLSKQSEEGYRALMPGVRVKTLCYGQRTLMTEFVMDQGTELPRHAHPHEQTGYLLRGHLRLSIDGQEHDVREGDSWCIPADVEHGARVLEDTVAVEVFSPVREAYLPK